MSGTRALVRFRWLDKTALRVPRFTAAVVNGRVQVTFDGKVRETGSGVARYDTTLDRRAPLGVGTDAADAPLEVGRPLPGHAHG